MPFDSECTKSECNLFTYLRLRRMSFKSQTSQLERNTGKLTWYRPLWKHDHVKRSLLQVEKSVFIYQCHSPSQLTPVKHTILVKYGPSCGLTYQNFILMWCFSPSTLVLSIECCRWDVLANSWEAVVLNCSLAVTNPSEHCNSFFLNKAEQLSLKLTLKVTLAQLCDFVLKGIRSMHTIIWEVV